MLKALPGFALIELPTKYESGLTTEKEKYAMRSEGILIESVIVADSENYNALEDIAELYGKASGHTVYFAPYEDGEPIKHENKEYVFVPVKSLRGVKQDAET
jgi:hypothetical protein